MKLFSWMHNKLGDKRENKRPTPRASTYHHANQEPREEFSDWPHGLLAIGTFGKNNEIMKENPASQHEEEEPSCTEEMADFTPEEVGEVQKELTKLLSKKPNVGKEISELPLDRFLNCPSSLDVDRRISNALCSESDDREDIEKTISVILGKCKEIYADNKKKAIGKKSISFLLKKMLVCSSGFAPTPSLRHPLQESRMEKLLRMILHKKINSQSTASRASSMKKYLEDKKTQEKNDDEDSERKSSDVGTWVKTDSECKQHSPGDIDLL